MTLPVVHPTTRRIYDALPELYRDADADQSDGPNGYPLLRFLSLFGDQWGEIVDLIDRFDYVYPTEGGAIATGEALTYEGEALTRIGSWTQSANGAGDQRVRSSVIGDELQTVFPAEGGLYRFELDFEALYDRAIVQVAVDDLLVGNVDQYAKVTTQTTSVVGWRALGPGNHTLRLIHTDPLDTTRLYSDVNRIRITSVDDSSDLSSPANADLAWLPWLGQLLGVQLNPGLSEQAQRDAVAYAPAGWRAGTRSGMADAARSALTGTRYVNISDHYGGDQWVVEVRTRPTETPDDAAVLQAIIDKRAKPAGIELVHTAYEASWDTVESLAPTWADWEAAGSWDAIQELGA